MDCHLCVHITELCSDHNNNTTGTIATAADMLTQPNDDDGSKYSNIVKTNAEHDTSVFTAKGLHQDTEDTPYNAQWNFGKPTLAPTNLEDKTEVKVD